LSLNEIKNFIKIKVFKTLEIDDGRFCITDNKRVTGIVQFFDEELFVWGDYPDPFNPTTSISFSMP